MTTGLLFLSVVIAGMVFTVPFATHADDRVQDQDNIRMNSAKASEEKLEHALKTGEIKNFYRDEIEKMGWQITSVNYDKRDYLEYEIVKGNDSYEVQIDFDAASSKATKVDVTVTRSPYLPAWFSF